jgi:hypothetical protein
VTLIAASGTLPKDELALYGEADFRNPSAHHRRAFTRRCDRTPADMFEDFFRLHATGSGGQPMMMEQTGGNYQLQDDNLQIIGLSNLGQAEMQTTASTTTTVTKKTETTKSISSSPATKPAARNITFVEIPSIEGSYKALQPWWTRPRAVRGRPLQRTRSALLRPATCTRSGWVPWPCVGRVGWPRPTE